MINKKAFGGSATSPLYETITPSGKKVTFTITDLVQGKGKIKDPDGDGDSPSFKPKKWKSSSLAERVSKQNPGKK